MNDIEILERLENMQETFIEEGLQGYEMIIVNTKNLINNLIARNKEIEKENWIMRTVDKQYISKDKIKEDYILKSKAEEKIEEINNEKLNYSEDEYYLENEIKGYAIAKIQELLQ